MELTELAGIGPVRAETLRAMGIFSLRDLLYMLPVRYEDHSAVSPCGTKQEGPVLVAGTLVQDPKLSFYHGLKKVTAAVEDSTGSIELLAFQRTLDVSGGYMQQNAAVIAVGKISEEFDHLFGCVRIQVTCRLVCYYYLAPGSDGTAYRRALLFSARKNGRPPCGSFFIDSEL